MESSYGFSSYHNGGPEKEQNFDKLAHTVGINIQKISQNVSSMEKMVSQLGTMQDSQELRNKLHQIQNYTQQLAKDTNANLKDLSVLVPPPSEQRQWKAQKERLAEEFGTALNLFQKSQRLAAQKEKEQVKRVRANSGLGDPFGGGNYPPLIELQDTTSRQQSQMQDEMNLQLLEEREQSIKELESNISDINQIFKELGSLVHEQGEVVDSIEASVERTSVFVSEGTSELDKARKYQTKVRTKKCILAICLAVVVGVIIGIIAWQVSN